VRGLAILWVLVHHAKEVVLGGGFIGVDVFFVLSGFLITGIIIREMDKTGRLSFKNFYMRRVLRLAPALLVVLVFNALLFPAFTGQKLGMDSVKESLIALFYMSNWARAFDWRPLGALSHTWSLSIEEQYYILWPVTFLAVYRLFGGKRARIAAAVIAMALASAFLRGWGEISGVRVERLYNGLDTHVDGILLGCAAAIFLSAKAAGAGPARSAPRLLRFVAPALLCYLAYEAWTLHWRDPSFYRYGLLAINASTAVIIADLMTSEKSFLRPIFEAPPLVWLGRVSYGLYLWHYVIYQIMLRNGRTETQILSFGLPISIAVAAASYYLMERKILALKGRFKS
jgi:peptidoglycan/LPS O-acetylase OafA/YrhL